MKYESYEEYDKVHFGTTGGSKEHKRLQDEIALNHVPISLNIFYLTASNNACFSVIFSTIVAVFDPLGREKKVGSLAC